MDAPFPSPMGISSTITTARDAALPTGVDPAFAHLPRPDMTVRSAREGRA